MLAEVPPEGVGGGNGYRSSACSDVCTLVESQIANLKEWLRVRLQLHEDLLRCLSNDSDSTGLGNRSTSVNNSLCPYCRAALMGSTLAKDSTEKLVLPDGQRDCTVDSAVQPGDDSLRMAASGEPHVSRGGEASTKASGPAPPPLPGVDAASLEAAARPPTTEPIPLLPGCTVESTAGTLAAASSAHQKAGTSSVEGTVEDTAENTVSPIWCQEHVPSGVEPEYSTIHLGSFQEQDLQSKLMDVFDQLDLDRSGCIDRKEFEEAFKEVGLPSVQALQVFQDMDASKNGVIDRVEWLHVVEQAARSNPEDVDILVKFVDRLAKRQRSSGRIYESDRLRRPFLILRHDSMCRMLWDLFIMILLFQVTLTLPYTYAYGESKVIYHVNLVVDILFCCDVCLNFRTTFTDRNESVIVSPKKIAFKYFRSWFLLDFFSSVPFDVITAGVFPNLTPARLLKVGKVAKVTKLLRVGKILKVLTGSELIEMVDQMVMSKPHLTFFRVVKLAGLAFVLAHWLACFGTALDDTQFNAYFGTDSPNAFQKYVAAMYWAMTTLSTVGYGDITPETDTERLYAMFAMVVGGAFYGFIVGSISSIVADMDLNKRAFYGRMDLVQSWLDRHDEIPKQLRQRVRKHFKLTLSVKSATDDATIVHDLSPALRSDIAFFIVHEKVRHNKMFVELPTAALVNLVEILIKTNCNATEFVVREGDPGYAMFILVDGVARYDTGEPWCPKGVSPRRRRYTQMIAGDSFGEEMVLGLAETYAYSIVAWTFCTFHVFPEDRFREQYRNLPELHRRMLCAFVKSRLHPTDPGATAYLDRIAASGDSPATSDVKVLDKMSGTGDLPGKHSDPGLRQQPYGHLGSSGRRGSKGGLRGPR